MNKIYLGRQKKYFSGILIDFDLTLTNSKYEITEETEKSLQIFFKKKIPVGLCSGKSYAVLKNIIFNYFPQQNLHIFSNGGQIISSTGNVLWENKLDTNLFRNIISATKKEDGDFCFSVGDIFYTSGGMPKVFTDSPWSVNYECFNEKIISTSLLSIDNANQILSSYIKGLAKSKLVNLIEIKKKNNYSYFDISPYKITKLAGLRRWAKILGINQKEIIAIGDGKNDNELICGAGLGVSMGNASEELKQLSDIIIGHTDDNGLAEFLSELKIVEN